MINYETRICMRPDAVVITVSTQIYNDRRLFFSGGPGVVPNDTFGSAASPGQNADRRSSRGRGMLLLSHCIFKWFSKELSQLLRMSVFWSRTLTLKIQKTILLQSVHFSLLILP